MVEELEEITDTFKDGKNGYMYMIFQSDTAIIQVVHPDFIPELGSEKLKFGLAVSFVFDQKISEEIQRHKKFMNSTHFSKFKRYEKGGEVLCYGVEMHLDYDATATLLEQILIEFFDFDASTEFESHLMDLGLLR